MSDSNMMMMCLEEDPLNGSLPVHNMTHAMQGLQERYNRRRCLVWRAWAMASDAMFAYPPVYNFAPSITLEQGNVNMTTTANNMVTQGNANTSHTASVANTLNGVSEHGHMDTTSTANRMATQGSLNTSNTADAVATSTTNRMTIQGSANTTNTAHVASNRMKTREAANMANTSNMANTPSMINVANTTKTARKVVHKIYDSFTCDIIEQTGAIHPDDRYMAHCSRTSVRNVMRRHNGRRVSAHGLRTTDRCTCGRFVRPLQEKCIVCVRIGMKK